MKKIEKIYNKLKKRLPKRYITPLKIYTNSKYMILALCRIEQITYKNFIKKYQRYVRKLEKQNQGYTDSKYYATKDKTFKTYNDFAAFSGDPIRIANDKVRYKAESKIAFLLLHEIGHNVCAWNNEKKADQFAVRWMRKLIKEGIIKYEG